MNMIKKSHSHVIKNSLIFLKPYMHGYLIYAKRFLSFICQGLNDDAIMQAVCAAVGPTGFISAVRRRCVSGKYETCDIICKNAVCSMRSIYMVTKDQLRKFETST